MWKQYTVITACIAGTTPTSAWLPTFFRSSPSSTTALSVQNIILSPSEDPTTFDSYKIGNARVHRYARDATDSDAEYVMWYHGRSIEMQQDTETRLPPLSTGRIGRATSRNGLIWEKDTVGSVSEDIPGVSLGLNQDAWWSFDVAHCGLGNVLLPMSTPAVLAEGGVYLMYYHGGNFEETPLAEYMPESSAATDVVVQGMKMRIGVAVSQDGVTWGRVEGDDPTGAMVVPFDKKDPNSWENVAVSDMPEELYCAWPDVAVDLRKDTEDDTSKNDEPKSQDSFLMYYSTMLKDTKEKCIAYATSADGFRWKKQGICLRPSDPQDQAGCARCCVFQDASYDAATSTWTPESEWKMLYEGVSPNDGKHRILWAVSQDAKTWSKKGIALDVGADGTWDCGGVGSPHIIRMDDGTERMYYTGQGADGSTSIGVAKLSTENGKQTWIREQASFSFS
ncbi:hypothetical protein FisN_18Lh104 [Fistulifera solaris]|uniref:Glycosyl hydrolase family 32 N-terminal domain-containing protein n=1 Tax=Fistulifera solaris TaxID=1519565 RepID=A0A1Z5KEU5_FISSO|nr:hypothetical protein FisN_18Lh104 [Fistulifera solaris]|eukprot:GAX24813.1 hypothetical protein FisN_18Lh104 [Fistulifera solaris]